ncbi:hypothetical protein B0I12_001926 [Microbacterium hydrothermale]|uniref:hypothetical protein n=1 Tax=Microbacterium hydrothermale TaxID=857427 RepID=UPI002226D097|nr:hypothetical protein [Microbacterium hydrothermale]MCW2164791.1 hypothetical protein [Microbacterium hydrothermale]
MPEVAAPAGVDLVATQRRTVRVLAAGQVLTGVAFGATLSLGALLAADLSGQEALSGFATASVTLGAALTAIPLARLAGRRGRRFALTTTAAVFADAQIGVLVALVLLGLGWSAATVAGSALLTEATPLALRPRRQGRSDTLMTACAAVGSVLAGIILGLSGYAGLALWALVSVAAVCGAAIVARRFSAAPALP